MTATAGAVEHHDRIGEMPVTVTPRCCEGRDVDAQLIHRLAGAETEVAKDDILLLHLSGIVDCRRRGRGPEQRQGKAGILQQAHARSPRLERRLGRSEEHTSELQSLMRISYAVFCLKKKNKRALKSNQLDHTTPTK